MLKKLENKYLLSFISGGFCALALAPINFFIAAIISISIFYLLLENKTQKPKQAFYLGLCYGYGYFLFGIYWIAISLLVDAQRFAWLIPFCLIFIPGAAALYFAGLAALYRKINNKFSLKFSYQKILIFALLWLFFEILRSNLLTGFSWNLIGYSLMFSNYTIQSASIFGIYGLSFLTILFCLIPISFIDKTRLGKIFSIILIIIFTGNFIFGYLRIQNTELKTTNTLIRLVQGNIEQDLKWDPAKKYQNFLKHIEITNSENKDNISTVIWSETATPYIIDNNAQLMQELQKAVPENGFLITGALRNEISRNSEDVYFNSMFLIDKEGAIKHYDKHHLVPFGEYIPFSKFLPFLEKITGGASGFGEGSGPKTLEMQGFRISPLICYEIIFSDKIIDNNNRPNLLVNVTNDAWFGNSSGPYQHFNMAKMRSVEYGISLARVANTGITAYIDPLGQVQKQIALNKEGFIDVNFVDAIDETIFSHFKYIPLYLALALIALFLVANIFYRKK